MPSVVIPRTIECVIQAVNSNGSEELNVLHFYKAAGGITITDLGNLANYFDAHVKASWLAVHDSGYVLNSLRLFSMESVSGAFLDYPFAPGTRGTFGGAVGPSNVALAVTVQTPYRGRRFRGRIFFGSIGSSAYITDTITPTFASLLVTVMNNLFATPSFIGFPLCVTSRVNLSSINANSYRIETTLDSQRRRLPGRGR